MINEKTRTITPFQLDDSQCKNGIQFLIEQHALGNTIPTSGEEIALSDVVLEAPIPKPIRNIFCVGKNYFDHAHEFANSGFDSSAAQGPVPEHPIVFSKVPESVTGTNTFIEYDK